GGRVPLQVIISSTPLLLNAPPMCSCALPSRRRVPPFVALPVMMSEPPRHSQTPRFVSDAQLTVPPWLDRTAPGQIVRCPSQTFPVSLVAMPAATVSCLPAERM